MRTTLNLDEDVAAQLSARARKEARSLSRVANDVLRDGFRSETHAALPPYSAPVFDTGRPLLDVMDVAEALEVLERGG